MIDEQYNWGLIFEYQNGGDLKHYLDDNKSIGIPLKLKLNFINQIVNGMAYLELNGIVHRDLACRNILLSTIPSNNRNNNEMFGTNELLSAGFINLKITDFGMSRKMEGTLEELQYKSLKKDIDLPIRWTSPEALIDKIFTSSSDVWSFGMVLWEIFSNGRIPFPEKTFNEAAQYLIKIYNEDKKEINLSQYLDVFNEHIPTKELYETCLYINPSERPSFRKISTLTSKRYYLDPSLLPSFNELKSIEDELNQIDNEIEILNNQK